MSFPLEDGAFKNSIINYLNKNIFNYFPNKKIIQINILCKQFIKHCYEFNVFINYCNLDIISNDFTRVNEFNWIPIKTKQTHIHKNHQIIKLSRNIVIII